MFDDVSSSWEGGNNTDMNQEYCKEMTSKFLTQNIPPGLYSWPNWGWYMVCINITTKNITFSTDWLVNI